MDEFSANINNDNTYACIIGNSISREILDIHWYEEICNAFIEGKNRLCKR